MRIMVANEPRAYREVIAEAFRQLRSDVEVITAEPIELDGAIADLAPDLVVCSQLSEVIETRPLAWILLYPDGQATAIISIQGHRSTSAAIEFTGLLAAVDQAETLKRTG
jgi:hypothetical protein